VDVAVQTGLLGHRVEKKRDQLDADESGKLEGTEILELTQWAWCSVITDDARRRRRRRPRSCAVWCER